MPSVITEPEDIADSASAGRSGGHVASADVPRSTKGATMKTAANYNKRSILPAYDKSGAQRDDRQGCPGRIGVRRGQ